MTFREPTKEEKEQLITWDLMKDYDGDEAYREDVQGSVDKATIVVFDGYYPGKGAKSNIMIVVWDSGPQHTEVFHWFHGEFELVEPDMDLLMSRGILASYERE